MGLLMTVLLVPSLHGDPGTVSPSTPRFEWVGAHVDAAAVPDASLCVATLCDTMVVVVQALNAPHAVEFSIRWSSEQNDFDVAVYDDTTGEMLGASVGGISTAESVVLDGLSSGRYRVVVVPVTVTDSAYQGLVELEPRAPLPPVPVEQLPELVSLAPRNLRIVAPVYLTGMPIEAAGQRPVSCGPDETLEHGATRCLRFDNGIANRGTGTLELRMRFEDVAGDTQDPTMYQRIYAADGSYRQVPVGAWEYHPIHAHFHYENFARLDLYGVDGNGERGPLVREGNKQGFCLVDIELDAWDGHNSASRHYMAPNCLLPQDSDDEGSWLVQGISRGWADIYTWDLPDQYIDITDVPDGVYELVATANPDGMIVEASSSPNDASVRFRLTGDDVEMLD